MSMTIFIDASHCHQTRAAGWGAWAKRDGWTKGRVFGGGYRSTMLNAAEAELTGIAEALTRLHADGALAEISHVVVQSDCLRALQLMAIRVSRVSVASAKENGSSVFLNRGMTPSPTETRALEVIGQIAERLPIFVRHVKGHSSGKGRSWVNRQCDRIARQHMEAERSRRRPC